MEETETEKRGEIKQREKREPRLERGEKKTESRGQREQ